MNLTLFTRILLRFFRVPLIDVWFDELPFIFKLSSHFHLLVFDAICSARSMQKMQIVCNEINFQIDENYVYLEALLWKPFQIDCKQMNEIENCSFHWTCFVTIPAFGDFFDLFGICKSVFWLHSIRIKHKVRKLFGLNKFKMYHN